jgi:hypothetical protein
VFFVDTDKVADYEGESQCVDPERHSTEPEDELFSVDLFVSQLQLFLAA